MIWAVPETRAFLRPERITFRIEVQSHATTNTAPAKAAASIRVEAKFRNPHVTEDVPCDQDFGRVLHVAFCAASWNSGNTVLRPSLPFTEKVPLGAAAGGGREYFDYQRWIPLGYASCLNTARVSGRCGQGPWWETISGVKQCHE